MCSQMEVCYKQSFSERVQIQYSIIDEATNTALEIIDKIPLQPGQTFVLGDYGTADGGTSASLLRKCIVHLKEKYGDDLPIQIVYEDQPTNDFNVIFKRVNGCLPSHKGLVTEFNNVFVLASGTEFFSQCMPAKSVNLIFSANALHFLRKSIGNSAAMATGLEGDVNERQAAKDWDTFLTLRAKELRPGGYLLTALPIVEIDQTGKLTKRAVPMMECVWEHEDIWKELKAEATITQDELRQMNPDIYIRSPKEYREPFLDELSSIRKAGLSLISMVIKMIPCPFRAQFIKQNSRDFKSAKVHAEKFVEGVRAWSEGTFIRALHQRSPSEKEKILSQYYQRYIDRVTANPENYGSDLQYAYIVIRKDASKSYI